jgi:hypothetical protein
MNVIKRSEPPDPLSWESSPPMVGDVVLHPGSGFVCLVNCDHEGEYWLGWPASPGVHSVGDIKGGFKRLALGPLHQLPRDADSPQSRPQR